MNLVPCKENCRWQQEGMCTLPDLTCPSESTVSPCRYFSEKSK